MREIKFRAWDGKKMQYDFAIDSQWNVWLSPYDTFDIEWWIIVQFTWLLDKNGKEIYEGDICYKPWYGKRCIIRWNREWLRWEAFYWIGKNLLDLTMPLWQWKKHVCRICEQCERVESQPEISDSIFPNALEIIWNIYENSLYIS
jgi:hypothetical protein